MRTSNEQLSSSPLKLMRTNSQVVQSRKVPTKNEVLIVDAIKSGRSFINESIPPPFIVSGGGIMIKDETVDMNLV